MKGIKTTEAQREAIRRAWGQGPLAIHVARCPACGRTIGAMPIRNGGFRLNDHRAPGDVGRPLKCSGSGPFAAEVTPL